MNVIQYLKQKGIRRTLQVLWQYKVDIVLRRLMSLFLCRKPLKDMIVIESHNDFDCNGGAFYDYLIQEGYNRRYHIVWLLRHPENAPVELPENVECLPLFYPNLRKAYVTCMAKVLMADSRSIEKARDDQISIYLGHGAFSLKNIKNLSPPRGNVYFENVDYIACSSLHEARILFQQLNLSHPDRRMAITGFPMHDVFFRKDVESDLAKLVNRKYHKTILWMPTFRKGGGYHRNDSYAEQPLGIPLFDRIDMLETLEKELEKLDVFLILKIHPMQDSDTIQDLREFPHIRILTWYSMKTLGLDNYRLMRDMDAMISDYSSAAYSFIMLDRPIGFLLSDQNDYKLGFSVDNLDYFIAGHSIRTISDFLSFIEDVSCERDQYREKRQALRRWLYQDIDGNSCCRIAKLLNL